MERARNVLVLESLGILCASSAGANQFGFLPITRKHKTTVKLIPVSNENTEKNLTV